MQIKSFITSVFAGLALFVSCEEPNTDLGAPALTLVESEITIDQAGGEKVITLSSTRDWMAASDGEWLVVTPESGSASADPQTVTVTALENTGMDREATVTFTIGMINRYLTVKQPGLGGSSDQLIVYHNDFDKEEATKTFGNGESWPYLDQFDGWMNQTGTGVANIEYAYSGMSARANSTSNSNYSDYEGSGSNNMFFGKNAYLAVKNIALGGATKFALSFGTEKYSQDNGSIFTPSEFHIWLSEDGNKWVELTQYTFAGGQTEGRWNIASANITLPAGTANLSICMAVDVASSYRMDDLSLVISDAEGHAVDFTNAVEIDFNDGGNSGGGNNGGDNPNPDNIIDVTVAEFLAAEPSETVWYRLKGEVVGPINDTYGNFDIKDATGQVYVYGISNWSQYDVKEGGTITIVGNRYIYNDTKDEVMNAYIESYDSSTETGDNGGGNNGGGDDPAPSTGKYEPQNITWTLGSSAYDNTSGNNAQTAVVNGETVNNLLKLGTGSKVGDATLHVPAGTKKLGAYIIAWKGKTASLKLSNGGTEIDTVEPAANVGASGNPPYTITLAETDYYEIEVNATAAMDIKLETLDPNNGRVLIIGLKAITE